MPKYYFDLADGQDFPDLRGSEWPDLRAARIEAVRYAAEVLKEMPDRFWKHEQWMMTVSNHHHRALFTLRFITETVSEE